MTGVGIASNGNHEIGVPPRADATVPASPVLPSPLTSGAFAAAAGSFPLCHTCNLPVKAVASEWFDEDSSSVIVGTERRRLAARTWRMLNILRSRPGAIFTHEYLLGRLEEMAGDARGYEAVTTSVRRIRQAISGSPFQINTIYGVGYRFIKEDTAS